MELRPIEVKPPMGKSFKGYFHKWSFIHARVGEQENGGPAAIIERKNGQVVLVDLEHASLRFTDVGPQ